MCDKSYILVEVVRSDGQVAAAPAQLRAAVARQNEVQTQLLDRTPVELECVNLLTRNK